MQKGKILYLLRIESGIGFSKDPEKECLHKIAIPVNDTALW